MRRNSAHAPALLSERECFSYGELARRANQYARWTLAQGIRKGQCVGLLMGNRPEFMACWLGITQAGGVVALLNTNLTGPSLAHSINLVAPKHLIVAEEFIDAAASALPNLTAPIVVWVHGASEASFHRVDRDLERNLEQYSGERFIDSERRAVTVDDLALYIYTSGTTGLPKAAGVTHGRVMQWTHWFAGLMDTRTRRSAVQLPAHVSQRGRRASAWRGSGSRRIGGLARKVFGQPILERYRSVGLHAGAVYRRTLPLPARDRTCSTRDAASHPDGLRKWTSPRDLGRVSGPLPHPAVLEFYAATEGNVSLFNVEGERGAIGRIPSYLAHRFPAALIQFNVEQGDPVRDEQGFCIRCKPQEVGEAIGPILNDSANIGGRFEGYSSREASEQKILRNVFKPGDAWYRTGDLMRKDTRGYFYFVDRIGDTFRWKGENVSTCEVSEALCAFPGIEEAIVYGVAIPGADGRAGMATLAIDSELDLAALRGTWLRDSRITRVLCSCESAMRWK